MPNLALRFTCRPVRRLHGQLVVLGFILGAGLVIAVPARAAETHEHGLRLTRHGEQLPEAPARGTVFQAYDLIETAAAARIVLHLESGTDEAEELALELSPGSAFLVLPNRRVLVLAGSFQLQPGDPGWVLEYRGLELVIGRAELDLAVRSDGGLAVSTRSGRAELRITEGHERVFVSPGVAAEFHPQLGLRNRGLATGTHTGQGASPKEYEQQRIRFLEAFARVFGEYGVIQDLRRIEQAERDGVPLAYLPLFPDGSGLSPVKLVESEGVPHQESIEAATRSLLQEAAAFDQEVRRITAGLSVQDADHELGELLQNRATRDRERLAAAYYAARLVLHPSDR